MRRSIKNIACFTLYLCCYFALTIFAQADAIVDLEYARYQGVQYQDPINHKNYTQFLGIRYAAAPTGKVLFSASHSLFSQKSLPSLESGSRRFRGPQPPSYTPGVQLANKQPSECFQASSGTAPESPFRNISSTRPAPSRRLEARTPRVDLSMRESSEDCLFLKYIFRSVEMCYILTAILLVSTFLVVGEKIITLQLLFGYTGIYWLIYLPLAFIL